MQHNSAALFLLIFFVSTSFAQTHERWDIKTLTDNQTINTTPKVVSVSQVGKVTKIKVRNATPRMKHEHNTITLKGVVSRIALETDGDYHIEVKQSGSDSTVACEAVDPTNTITATSPFINDFKTVRSKAKTLKVGSHVTITGVMFQDKYHNPSPNRTRNFVEIHPILKIE